MIRTISRTIIFSLVLFFCILGYVSSTFAQEDDDTEPEIINVAEQGIYTDTDELPSGSVQVDRSSDAVPGSYTSPNSGTNSFNPESGVGSRAFNPESGSGGCPPGQLCNPLKSKSIEEFLLKIIDVILVFALPIIILYIMYAGYLFVTARGDTGQIETARTALLWSIVGGVIVLGARLIISVIQGTIQAF